MLMGLGFSGSSASCLVCWRLTPWTPKHPKSFRRSELPRSIPDRSLRAPRNSSGEGVPNDNDVSVFARTKRVRARHDKRNNDGLGVVLLYVIYCVAYTVCHTGTR